jgi:hypothetical protein
MRSNLKLLARFLIHVRRSQHGPFILDRWQWNRTSNTSSGSLCSFNNLGGGLVQHSMIVGLESNSNFFVHLIWCLVLCSLYFEGEPSQPLPLLTWCLIFFNKAPSSKYKAHSYSITSETVPAPTVRPPSRMAKRKPFSMAIGAINSISIATLSPGITISTPAGNAATPVTSVVRK